MLDHEREITPDWLQREQAVGYVTYVDRFAGTLAGVRERLPYLRELGVTLPAPDAAAARRGRRPTTAATRWSTTARSSRRWGRWTTCARWPTDLRAAGMALCVDLVLNHTARRAPVGAGGAGGRRRRSPSTARSRTARSPTPTSARCPTSSRTPRPGSFTLGRRSSSAGSGRRSTPTSGTSTTRTPTSSWRWPRRCSGWPTSASTCCASTPRRSCGSGSGTNCQNQPEVHELLQAFRAAMRIAAPGGRVQGRGDRRAARPRALPRRRAGTRARSATSPTTTCSWSCCGARWPRAGWR